MIATKLAAKTHVRLLVLAIVVVMATLLSQYLADAGPTAGSPDLPGTIIDVSTLPTVVPQVDCDGNIIGTMPNLLLQDGPYSAPTGSSGNICGNVTVEGYGSGS